MNINDNFFDMVSSLKATSLMLISGVILAQPFYIVKQSIGMGNLKNAD
jgi:hypothetical protein